MLVQARGNWCLKNYLKSEYNIKYYTEIYKCLLSTPKVHNEEPADQHWDYNNLLTIVIFAADDTTVVFYFSFSLQFSQQTTPTGKKWFG